jgi:DNA helicase HerA-like ATPase
VREIVSNALARHLLGLARAGRFINAPLILAVDEAHQMLPTTSSPLSNEYPLEAFNIIAKEGRKYGLTLCVATQRPRDIPDDVLSQVGTFLVHRLVSDADRNAIERASGAVSNALQTRLPSLSPGEAFLIGVDFHNPLRLRIERPIAPPISNGPNFQASWGAATLQ